VKGTRYVHTNLIARDWRALASFYERVFGCDPVPPERDYRGPALDAGTGLSGARLRGVHLRLPGHGDDGPTLEIFGYQPAGIDSPRGIATPGFGHIAFAVESVPDAREEVLANGGEAIGEVVTLATADGQSVTWCYVTDPEGNAIELQAWS